MQYRAKKEENGMRASERFPRLRVDPIAGTVFLGLLLTDRSGLCFALLFAATVHEIGHLLAARVLGVSVSALRIGLLGARIEVRGDLLSYGSEWLLAAAGPFASFACACVTAPFRNVSDFAMRICAISLLLGALNLLPVDTFDGGRMTRCALAKLFGIGVSAAICRALSFGTLFLLWSASVYLLLRAGSGISWLGFSVSLFDRFFETAEMPVGSLSAKIFGEKQRKTEQNKGKMRKL